MFKCWFEHSCSSASSHLGSFQEKLGVREDIYASSKCNVWKPANKEQSQQLAVLLFLYFCTYFCNLTTSIYRTLCQFCQQNIQLIQEMGMTFRFCNFDTFQNVGLSLETVSPLKYSFVFLFFLHYSLVQHKFCFIVVLLARLFLILANIQLLLPSNCTFYISARFCYSALS